MWKWYGLFAVILLALTGTSGVMQTATPYPTWYPPSKQTLEAMQRETKQAATLTPFPTGTLWSFPPLINTSIPALTVLSPSTPAGDGVIMDDKGDSIAKALGVNTLSMWQSAVGNRIIVVFAGSDYLDDSQGIVYVSIYSVSGTNRIELPDGGLYPTPNRSGAVSIIGAQGQRLILQSTGDETYYFDVLGEQFTSSLTDIVSTATPWPITLSPSFTPTLSGDEPHTPEDIVELSPLNTPIHGIISHAGDENWFRFRIPGSAAIQVYLDNLPANYDVYVYSYTRVSYVGADGQSTNPATTSELVTINNAPADDYLVRVVSVNGAFDPNNAYRLEFDVLSATPTSTPLTAVIPLH